MYTQWNTSASQPRDAHTGISNMGSSSPQAYEDIERGVLKHLPSVAPPRRASP